ncbi:cysteine/serine-rich nuclear protein 1 [Chironomus tepperi]|uniref:cysteine/serine-rich nuclear protein 1 n=1 Tax=Chironomus tepperi TaxID=113505 RepID=UPI00391FBB68
MLKPIKTFFNYLQKNANTSNIFRFSNDINMSDEINSSPNEGDNTTYEDPLTDPLAIDDEYGVNSDENILQIESKNVDSTLENDFVFVDIEKLKKNTNSVDETEQIESKLKHSNHIELSDINGNKDQVINDTTVKNCKSLISDKKEEPNRIEFSQKYKSSDRNEMKNRSIALINKTGDDCDSITNDKAESSSVKETDTNKNIDNISFVISATSSEPDETEEIIDTSEIRSDGSDSGLGLDILRNISMIEKSLAALTPSKSSLKRRSSELLHDEQPKKQKHGINFGNITVYYFPRCQGFGCVPTQGGSTLGMTAKHAYKKTFSLSEHALEQRRLNRLKIAGNELNQCSSSSDESKSDDEISENSLSEADSEAYGFLQPITARQRRALLKNAGVRKIDTAEKDECRQLRISREICGCSCRGFCDPDTCECSLAGIKCQVDRLKPHEFPCGCTRDGCANVNGRVEFNPSRVKTHFIHTIMRLELEKRQELSEDSNTNIIPSLPPAKWWMRLQSTQSNASTSYNNYVYNNGMSTSQYSGKIPPLSMMSTSMVNQESLDLHYAYRDEYINNLTLSAESNNGSFNSNSSDYFSSYNYLSTIGSLSPNNTVHGGWSSNGHAYNQHHQGPHSQIQITQPHQSNFSSDCQYSNFPPNNGSSLSYKVDTVNEINDIASQTFIANNHSSSMHNGAVTNRVSYQNISLSQPQEISNNSENFCSSSQNVNRTNCIELEPTTSKNDQNDNNNEKLTEIIKKSIVESVTA